MLDVKSILQFKRGGRDFPCIGLDDCKKFPREVLQGKASYPFGTFTLSKYRIHSASCEYILVKLYKKFNLKWLVW